MESAMIGMAAGNYPNMGRGLRNQLVPPAAPSIGVGGAADELLNATALLHSAISELEVILENNGLLRAAPPAKPLSADSPARDQRVSLAETIRTGANSAFAARDRVMVLRDRLDV